MNNLTFLQKILGLRCRLGADSAALGFLESAPGDFPAHSQLLFSALQALLQRWKMSPKQFGNDSAQQGKGKVQGGFYRKLKCCLKGKNGKIPRKTAIFMADSGQEQCGICPLTFAFGGILEEI